MIEGLNVYMRPMEIEDVPFKVQWVNDPEVRKMLLFPDYPASRIATQNWLINAAKDASRKDFMVCLKTDDTPIGFAGLKAINVKNLSAESYLGIGVKKYWGKGYGFDIKKCLLMYAFDVLGLNKIYSLHLPDNEAMIKINIKLGGKEEGVLREDVFVDGILRDRLLVSVLKKEMAR